MSRWWVTPAAVVAAAALVVVAPGTAQPPPLDPRVIDAAAPGRYQVQVIDRGGASTVFVADTQTGRVWYRPAFSPADGWTDLASPLATPAAPPPVTGVSP